TLGCVHRTAAPVAHQARTGNVRKMTAAQAYAEVERLTRRRARNFAYGIMVLPREKRRAIAAIYAFARRVDDVADGELPVDEKREQLEQVRAALSSPGGDAMSVALVADVPGRARPCLSAGGPRAASLAGWSKLVVRLDVRRALPRHARTDRGARLRRLRRTAATVRADEAADRRRRSAAMKAAVV